ncbi:MAG: hypothetical protein ABI885_28390 [Gammaproteobacteria bacterium]
MCEPIAQLLARDDCRAHRAEVHIAAGVVPVKVRVHDIADGLRRQLPDGGGEFVAEWGELRVDHEHTIRPDK